MFITLEHVMKSYQTGERSNVVLNDVNLSIEKGEVCVIMGPSGSGKSTLLNAIGGLDGIDSGRIVVDGTEITNSPARKLTEYRRKYLGYIFQFYNLVPDLSIQENIQVGAYLTEHPLKLDELLHTLGIAQHVRKFPAQLSGGEQQRCAIARAVIKNPDILLCDEPTGALDYKSSKEILCLLEEVNQKYGTTVIMVTHNAAFQKMAHHIVEIRDGALKTDLRNDAVVAAQDIEW